MSTVYCPANHVLLSQSSVGTPYGHVHGHRYHDVDVLISRSTKRYRCHVVETWGVGRVVGRDREEGRIAVVGRGDSAREAVSEAQSAAYRAGVNQSSSKDSLAPANAEPITTPPASAWPLANSGARKPASTGLILATSNSQVRHRHHGAARSPRPRVWTASLWRTAGR